ncbi:MAG TPA: peptidase [Gammaproteobacteria bacterium]|nr:peptidase [Gammaproteobacteria bacterium]
MKQQLVIILLVSLLMFSASSFARHDLADKLEREGQIMTLEEILQIANKEHSGRILEAELETRKGHYIYQIDILDNEGVVWELEYDAANGQLITKERD